MPPGIPFTGAPKLAPPSVDLKTSIASKLLNPSVLMNTSSVCELMARFGSPPSPLALVGRVPRSVNEPPELVELEKPVNLLAPPRKLPESLNPTTTFDPFAATEVSLWVS